MVKLYLDMFLLGLLVLNSVISVASGLASSSETATYLRLHGRRIDSSIRTSPSTELADTSNSAPLAGTANSTPQVNTLTTNVTEAAKQEAPQDVMKMLSTVSALDNLKELADGMKIEELTSTFIAVCENDTLLSNLDSSADTLNENTSSLVSVVKEQLEILKNRTKQGGPEVIVQHLQDFFKGQMDRTTTIEDSLRLLGDLILQSTPPDSWEKLGPVVTKVVSRMGSRALNSYRDMHEFVNTDSSSFCQAVTPYLQNTSLAEASYAQQAEQTQFLGKMLPSLLASFITPDRMPKVQNVTRRFTDSIAATFTSVGSTASLLVKEVGCVVEQRLNCSWQSKTTKLANQTPVNTM
jgi:hypothetical protein